MSLKRWSAKSKNIDLRIEPTKARGINSATCVVAFPLKTNPWVLESLHCGSMPISTKNLDESILAYAVYKIAWKKLMSPSKSGIASGATSVKWGSHGDEFQICATVGPRISSVRKAAGLIVSSLKFGSLFSKYSSYCRSIGIKPEKSAFEHAATAANAALNSGVTIVATGRLAISKRELVDHAAEVINGKLKITQASGKGSSRSVESKEKPEDYYDERSAAGLEGVVAKGYIDQQIPECSHLHGGKLWISKKSVTKVENSASPDRIKQYVRGLESLKDEMVPAIVHIGAMHGYVSTKYLDAGKSLSASSLVSAVSKVLK